MPRGNKDRNPEQHDQLEAGGEAGGQRAPGLQSWFEDAWHGWLKPVGGIVAVVLAYLLYEYRVVPEQYGGRLLIALILGVAIYTALDPVRPRMEGARGKALVTGLAVAWVIAAAGPLFGIVFWPPKTLAEAHISADKGAAPTEIKLPDGENGPYELAVSGSLRGAGEAEASYTFEVKGAGDSSKRVEGSIKRTFVRQRVSRRSSGSVSVREEHGEDLLQLDALRGNKLTITAEIAGELDDGLHVAVHRAPVAPHWFWLVGFAVFVVGLVVDYRMIAPKMERTYVAAAAAFTLAFVIYYPMEATPHNLVRPGIGALVLALLVGFLPGWAISAIAGSFKPRPKKLAGVKA